jgi:hypothetical protein
MGFNTEIFERILATRSGSGAIPKGMPDKLESAWDTGARSGTSE